MLGPAPTTALLPLGFGPRPPKLKDDLHLLHLDTSRGIDQLRARQEQRQDKKGGEKAPKKTFRPSGRYYCLRFIGPLSGLPARRPYQVHVPGSRSSLYLRQDKNCLTVSMKTHVTPRSTSELDDWPLLSFPLSCCPLSNDPATEALSLDLRAT